MGTVNLEESIEVLMSQMQSEEDSDRDSGEGGEIGEQLHSEESVQVGQKPTETPIGEDQRDPAPVVTGSGTSLNLPEEFGYENFHILNYHAGIASADPVVTELRQQYLDADDCLTHV